MALLLHKNICDRSPRYSCISINEITSMEPKTVEIFNEPFTLSAAAIFA